MSLQQGLIMMLFPSNTSLPGRTHVLLKRRQSGAALIISLIILVVMTIIGVSSIQTTSLEERMAGNMRDHNLAFQAAEAALRYAEQDIEERLGHTNATDATIQEAFGDGSDGWFHMNNPEPSINELTQSTFWEGRGIESVTSELSNEIVGGGQVQSEPKYIIRWLAKHALGSPDIEIDRSDDERDDTDSEIYIFRITARGTGGSNQSQVVLRSYYSLSL